MTISFLSPPYDNLSKNFFFSAFLNSVMEENADRYFGACGVLGDLEAKEIWSRCIAIGGKSKEIVRIARLITQAKNRLVKMEKEFTIYLDDVGIFEIKNKGKIQVALSREQTESRIEADHRPPHVIMDNKAFQNLTNVDVPNDVMLGFSWGPKFTFPYILNAHNIQSYLAQVDYTVEKTVPTGLYDQVHHEIANHIIPDLAIHEWHIKWLLFLRYRLDNFLKLHADVIPVLADKGKIIVLIYLEEYRSRTLEHLNDERHYLRVDVNPIGGLIGTEIDLLRQLRENDHVKEFLTPYQENCMLLPKFYVTIKVHKNNAVRPITSNAGNTVGATLNGVFNRILMEVFPPGRIHYKNAKAFKDEIVKLKLNSDDILVSYDAISMFTSIPTYLVIQIIEERLVNFKETFDLDPALVMKIAIFLLKDCVFFTALGNIYKQTHGLPMGGAISPLCCRIIMDFIIDRALMVIPKPLFMGIYVDDTLFVLKDENVNLTLNALNSVVEDIQFTFELEIAGCLNFLNLTLMRGLHDIKTNWFKKPLASNRLLNYYSSHKRSTVLNTARQFIRTVIELSDGNLFMDNKDKIIITLRENCFPETLIITLIHENYTLMRPMLCAEKVAGRKYVSFPHQINNKVIKDTIRNYKTSNLVLAESIRNNKINPIRIYKTKTDLEDRTNMILVVTCICKSKVKVQMTKFNQTCGMLVKVLVNEGEVCATDYHVFKNVEYFRGLNSKQQTSKLLSFYQWKHRHKLNGVDFQFPNRYLRKIMLKKFPEN